MFFECHLKQGKIRKSVNVQSDEMVNYGISDGVCLTM